MKPSYENWELVIKRNTKQTLFQHRKILDKNIQKKLIRLEPKNSLKTQHKKTQIEKYKKKTLFHSQNLYFFYIP